jgi:hypothetical protein
MPDMEEACRWHNRLIDQIPIDSLKAGNILEQIAIETMEQDKHVCLAALSKVSDSHISTVQNNNNDYQEGTFFWDANKIEQFVEPTSWQIVKRTNDDSVEEAIFTVQGIIHAKELPLVTLKPRYVR